MKKGLVLVMLLWGVIGMVACTGSPVAAPSAPTTASGATALSTSSGTSAATAAGNEKYAIAGTLAYVGQDPPSRMVVTPSGMCHAWIIPVYTHLDGDVEGPVTFIEQGHPPCAGGHLPASGPVDGQVTWNGRSGAIQGQWTTNCKSDPTTPSGISCDGTMNLRGSGGLEGVQFHFKWGPGWFPFPYTGTAFEK